MDSKLRHWIIVLSAFFLWACADEPLATNHGDVAGLNARGDRHTVVVNATASGNGVARTVQEGINMVAEGGKVKVKPGVYEERITIDRGLSLEAIDDGSGPVVIKHSQSTSAPATESVIKVDTPEPVVIRGITVHHDNIRGVNVLSEGPHVLTEANVTIEQMSFTGVSTSAPIVGNGVSVHFKSRESGKRARIVVRDSRFAVGGIGISFGGDVDGLIEGNEVRNGVSRLLCVNVSTVGQGGTMLTSPGSTTNVVIINNLFEDCGENAFGRYNSVVIAGSPGATTTGTVSIVGNVFRNTNPDRCPASAISYEHYTGVIEHNQLVSVIGDECASDNPTRNWRSAIFIGSKIAGIRPAVVAVRFNDIVGNFHAGLRIGSNQPTPIDATCNWWGASGPTLSLGEESNAIVVPTLDVAPSFTPFATAPIAGTSQTGCAGGV